MPETAAIFAELRTVLAPEHVDRLVRAAMAGKAGVCVAEVGPDGVLREFGRLADGRRCVVVQGGAMRWMRRDGTLAPEVADLPLMPPVLNLPRTAPAAKGGVR